MASARSLSVPIVSCRTLLSRGDDHSLDLASGLQTRTRSAGQWQTMPTCMLKTLP